MRAVWLLLPVFVAALAPTAAHADGELAVTLESRYLDTRSFNNSSSDAPSLQFDGYVYVTPHAYVSGYLYTGFKKPLSDESSEYGFEAGEEIPVSKDVTLTLAAGRYANYGGEGFHAGDWYAKAMLESGPATASVTALSGDTDSVLLNVSYSLPVTDKLTVTPSLAFFTRDTVVNPAVTVTYSLTDSVKLSGKFVLPEDEHGDRTFCAAAVLTVIF